jgi:hypothetical protein
MSSGRNQQRVPKDFPERQLSLATLCSLTAAVDALSQANGVEERGAIFTRREVVEFILDLVGYTVDQPLHRKRLLEPSFGGGDFLLPAIERLLSSWKGSSDKDQPLEALADAIRAVELHRDTFTKTYTAVVALLKKEGIPACIATAITDRWLTQGDFLLVSLPESFNVVIGNPPYVRTELIPDVLMAEYRSHYTTIYDRADLYIPFIERSLRKLAPAGVLGFICADRWMKNRYGGPLRELVASGFHLKVYVDMTDTPAFRSDVIAYPAVIVISREKPGFTRIAHRPAIDTLVLRSLAAALTSSHLPHTVAAVQELSNIAVGSEPWLHEASEQMNLVRRLESTLPLLEHTGCKVGIGVATGADHIYIGQFDLLNVEDDRKLPLAMTRDIASGKVQWRGYGVINPFRDDGSLVSLKDHPRLRRYLEEHKAGIMARHVARKNPGNWYRTIDRITPSLAGKPKLLIPDIKGEAQIVYEDGQLYPHHNLYYIVSEEWDLHALQAVLLSGIARLFVATYSTRMRGGYLRFQAQYLRRIRVPYWQDVPMELRQALKNAALSHDLAACNAAAFSLYNLTPSERSAIGGNGDSR